MPYAKAVVLSALICVLIVLTLLAVWRQLERAYLFAPVGGQPRPALRGVVEGRLDRLHLWVIEAPRPDAPAVVFFHGNFGNLEHTTPFVELLSGLGTHVVSFDYSGYGVSGGTPSTEQILSDGLLVYEHARLRWPASRIILWGHSLGTAVATYVAGHVPRDAGACSALVLMAPFYALSELGRDFGGFYHVASAIFSRLVNMLPTNEWIRRVDCPIAIVHSLRDPLISFRHAMMLYDELTEMRLAQGFGRAEVRRSLLLIPTEGNHSCCLLSCEQLATLAAFLGLAPQMDECARLLEAAHLAPECQ